jgi:hypothetical protein
MAAQIEEHTAPLEKLDEDMEMVPSTQAILGSLDFDDIDEDDKNRPRADSDLVEADHALGEVKQGSAGAHHEIEAKYLDEDGNLEPSVQALDSAVGTEVNTDYGKATVEKIEEIAGEMFLVIKYEDGSEENIKYDELDSIKVSSKKSSSTTKTTSTKKVTEAKAAVSPKASPVAKKTTVKKIAKQTIVKPKTKSKAAATTKKTVSEKAKKPVKKTAPSKVNAKKTATKTPKVVKKPVKKTTGKR